MTTKLPTRATRQQELPSVIETPDETIKTPSMSIDQSVKAALEVDNVDMLDRNHQAFNEQFDLKIDRDVCDQEKLAQLCREHAVLTGRPVADVIDQLSERLATRQERRKHANILAKKDQVESELQEARERGLNARSIRDSKVKEAEIEYRQKQLAISNAEAAVRQLEEARMFLVKTCDSPSLTRRRRVLNAKWEEARAAGSIKHDAVRDTRSSLERAKQELERAMSERGPTQHPDNIAFIKERIEILNGMLPGLEKAHEEHRQLIDALNAEIEACDEAMTRA